MFIFFLILPVLRLKKEPNIKNLTDYFNKFSFHFIANFYYLQPKLTLSSCNTCIPPAFGRSRPKANCGKGDRWLGRKIEGSPRQLQMKIKWKPFSFIRHLSPCLSPPAVGRQGKEEGKFWIFNLRAGIEKKTCNS